MLRIAHLSRTREWWGHKDESFPNLEYLSEASQIRQNTGFMRASDWERQRTNMVKHEFCSRLFALTPQSAGWQTEIVCTHDRIALGFRSGQGLCCLCPSEVSFSAFQACDLQCWMLLITELLVALGTCRIFPVSGQRGPNTVLLLAGVQLERRSRTLHMSDDWYHEHVSGGRGGGGAGRTQNCETLLLAAFCAGRHAVIILEALALSCCSNF